MLQYQSIEYVLDNQKYIGELVYSGVLDKTRKVIIVFSAMEGRGEFTLEYAADLASNGFVAFVADVYGDGSVFSDLDSIFACLMPLISNRSEIRKRSVLAYDTVTNLPWVNHESVGAIGFCLGGMCVLEVARSGIKLKAGVSVHGVLGKSELKTASPVKTKLLILAGHADPQVPSDVSFNDFTKEMTSAGNTDWVFTFFGGVKHSFSDKKTGSFDKKREDEMGREYNDLAAKLSFKSAVDFFNQVL